MGIFNRSGIPRGYMHLDMVKFGALPMPDIMWVTRNMNDVKFHQGMGDVSADKLESSVGVGVIEGIISHLGLVEPVASEFRTESLFRFRWAYAIARDDGAHLNLDPPVVLPAAQQAVHLRGMDMKAELPDELAMLLPSITHAGLFVGRGGLNAERIVQRFITAIPQS
jgi:hypothetical protein